MTNYLILGSGGEVLVRAGSPSHADSIVRKLMNEPRNVVMAPDAFVAEWLAGRVNAQAIEKTLIAPVEGAEIS